MSEQVVTKQCCKCKQTKSINLFSKNKHYRDGFQYECKLCRLQSNRIWRRTHSGRKCEYNSRHTEKGRKTVLRRKIKYRRKYPERIKAQQSVRRAIKKGVLPHLSECSCILCSKSSAEYHHWSYLPQHWMDVWPVCVACHNKLHKRPS